MPVNFGKSLRTGMTYALMAGTLGCSAKQEEVAKPKPKTSMEQTLKELARPEKPHVNIKAEKFKPSSEIISANLSQADKDWLIEKEQQIFKERSVQIQLARKHQKIVPDIDIYMENDAVKTMETIHAKMETLKANGVIDDKQIELLKKAFGLRGGLNYSEGVIGLPFPDLGGPVHQAEKLYLLNLSQEDLVKLDTWVRLSANANEKENLTNQIRTRIEQGLKPSREEEDQKALEKLLKPKQKIEFEEPAKIASL